MLQVASQVQEALQFIRTQTDIQPIYGVVLGTGLGQLVPKIDVAVSIPYTSIPHFASSTVESHKGQLIFGTIDQTPVVAMQGRFHYYEGYTMQQITFPIRLMKALGVQKLLISNAAGGVNPSYKKGDLVLLEDHINLQSENPLRGKHDPQLGDRFPDMSSPYNAALSNQLSELANLIGKPLKKGIYVAVSGPNLETRAEYRFIRLIGGDLVGMSTVPEVIVANQIQLPCAAISVVTDECDPDHLVPVSLREILEVAAGADAILSEIFARLVAGKI